MKESAIFNTRKHNPTKNVQWKRRNAENKSNLVRSSYTYKKPRASATLVVVDGYLCHTQQIHAPSRTVPTGT